VSNVFSVELKSKAYVKKISISNEAYEKVLFEGDLGKLEEIALVEGDVLEINGINGTLRANLSKKQLQKVIDDSKKQSLNSKMETNSKEGD
jgi:hypothetical protein